MTALDLNAVTPQQSVEIVRSILDASLNTDKIVETLQDAPREHVEKGSALDQRIRQAIDSPKSRSIIQNFVDLMRPKILNLAEWIAKTAAKIVSIATSDPIVKTIAPIVRTIDPIADKFASLFSKILRAEIDLIAMALHALLRVIDVVLRVLSPFIAIALGYGIKVMVPVLLAAAAGIVGVSLPAAPLALLSDPRCKQHIRAIHPIERRALIDAMYDGDTPQFWQYIGDPRPHIGAMADQLPWPIADGHSIDLVSYLASLHMAIAELNERVHILENQNSVWG